MAKRGKSRASTAPPRRRAPARRARQPLPSKDKRNTVVALRRELSQARQQLSEASEQQAASAEVLRIISASPGDVQPVFQAILANATRICEAQLGTLVLYEEGRFRNVGLHGAPPAYAELRKRDPFIDPGPENDLSRIAATKQAVHIADVAAQPASARGRLAELAGARTLVAVPMLNSGELVGAITIYRQEVRPFTDRQVELLTSFAAQAVIAIENTRLLGELRESLQQQTATADVLKVISRSRFVLQPVFNTVLENAVRLCEAERSFIYLFNGKVLRAEASYNTSPELREFIDRNPVAPGRHSAAARAALERRTVHIPDVQADPEYTWGVGQVEPLRTLLGVPMLKGDELVGVIVTQKREVKPFTDKQIALVEAFADQAVIAIENARLLNELRARTGDLSEALEQQTATSQVLQVISSSPGELKPVFEAMLENATRLCGAGFGNLFLREGDGFRAVAVHGPPTSYVDWYRREPVLTPAEFVASPPLARVAASKTTLHILDLSEDQSYIERNPRIVALVESARARTVLGVPMLKENELIGAIFIYRQEVRPFSDKQIELLSNFASQAVIAIENARLLSDLREALQQQTATADVLAVISSSRFDVEPVFEAIIKRAAQLCQSVLSAIYRSDGELVHLVAHDQFSPESVAAVRAAYPVPVTSSNLIAVAIRERRVVHIPNVLLSGGYTEL